MFLKIKNIIFKIRRSKVTDYAALKQKIHGQSSLDIFVPDVEKICRKSVVKCKLPDILADLTLHLLILTKYHLLFIVTSL